MQGFPRARSVAQAGRGQGRRGRPRPPDAQEALVPPRAVHPWLLRTLRGPSVSTVRREAPGSGGGWREDELSWAIALCPRSLWGQLSGDPTGRREVEERLGVLVLAPGSPGMRCRPAWGAVSGCLGRLGGSRRCPPGSPGHGSLALHTRRALLRVEAWPRLPWPRLPRGPTCPVPLPASRELPVPAALQRPLTVPQTLLRTEINTTAPRGQWDRARQSNIIITAERLG